MTPEARFKLKSLLIDHESYRQFAYSDTTGHLTIGIGRNLTDRGISYLEAQQLLDGDIEYFYTRLSTGLKFFDELSENRQVALIDMCFNVGYNGFMNFSKMMLALEMRDYARASDEILKSKAAVQAPLRYSRLAQIIKEDEL